MLTWSTWNSWKKLIFKNASLNAFNTIRTASSLYLDFILASKEPDRLPSPSNRRSPLLGRVKLHAGIACFEDESGGVAFIIRDS